MQSTLLDYKSYPFPQPHTIWSSVIFLYESSIKFILHMKRIRHSACHQPIADALPVGGWLRDLRPPPPQAGE